MLLTMNNKFTKIYLEFMSYTLGLLNDFNTLFQSEASLLYKVKLEIECLLRTLCNNYMDLQYIKISNILNIDHKNPRHFLTNDKIYLGILATASLLEIKEEVEQQALNVFFTSCLNFYIELFTDIRRRFTFKEPIFQVINLVDPVVAQYFDVKSLLHVTKMFPILEPYVNVQEVDNEWREHALLDFSNHNIDKNKAHSAEDYWRDIFDLKNAAGLPKFKNLQIVIQFLLILPFSNASVERIFSNLNNIKTDTRNKLGRERLASILHTKQAVKDSGGIVSFQPSKTMLNVDIWKNNKVRYNYLHICFIYIAHVNIFIRVNGR